MSDLEPDLDREIELLEKVGEGDRRSFEEVYARYSGVLYSTAFRVVNNEDDAKDILQDAFLQIWEKARLYDASRGKPLTWAMTLTRNKAIDRLRSLQRRYRLRDEAQQEADVHKDEARNDAADEVFLLEKGEVVRDAVMQLSKEQREAIEMAFFGGLTQSEIAEELGEPLGTIKARIRRGMMRLKSLVGSRL